MIINAAHRTDRRQEMRSALHRVGWDPDGPKMTWFPAIDPKTAVETQARDRAGVSFRHIAVLNIARSAGHQRVLVLEDDCDFAPTSPVAKPRSPGGLRRSPGVSPTLVTSSRVPGPPRLVPWGPDQTIKQTHCYAVAGNVLSRLPGYLEAITLRSAGSPEGGPMSIDAGFSWFRRHNPDVLTVLAAPSLAYQRSSRSDLSPRWFDRVLVLRDAVQNIRAWRHRRRVEA